MKTVEFIATYGIRLAIAKITWDGLVEYSVCNWVDYEKKDWKYSSGYFRDFNDAGILYAQKILEVTQP